MRAVDTSVAVAGFGDWHRLNRPARDLLDEGVALPAHALAETYSVLSGFPPPHRAPAGLVSEWLKNRFLLILPSPEPEEIQKLIADLATVGRTGGAIYDGLIALTAKLVGAELITADRRAATTYELTGVEWVLLER